MQALIPIGWQDLIGQGFDWLHRYVLLPALLAQLGCVVVLLGAARWASPTLQRSASNSPAVWQVPCAP
jgi:hypothetical protein